MRRWWLTVARVGVIAALLSGCTAADTRTTSPGEGTPASSRATASSAVPSPAQPPSSKQLHAALLKHGDLPPVWTAAPSSTVDSDLMPAFVSCMGAPEARGERLDEITSPEFSDDQGNQVNVMLATFSTHERVVSDGALFGDARAESCLTEVFLESFESRTLPPGAEMGTLQVAVTPGDGGGASNVVATTAMSMPVVTAMGQRVTVHMDFVVLTGRSTRAVVTFASLDAQVPAELRGRLVSTIAERVAAL